MLLASVFFSGLLLDLQQFVPAVQAMGDLLPVTHGIRLLQDLMLRGSTTEPWHFWALATIASVSLVATWLLLRRGSSSRSELNRRGFHVATVADHEGEAGRLALSSRGGARPCLDRDWRDIAIRWGRNGWPRGPIQEPRSQQ